MGRSVLDDLGQEVTGIAAPVSICMALTVALVRLLNPEGESNAGSVSVASIYYSENVRGLVRVVVGDGGGVCVVGAGGGGGGQGPARAPPAVAHAAAPQ